LTWIITGVQIAVDGSGVWITVQEQGGRKRRPGYMSAGEAAVMLHSGPALFDGKPAKEAR
jgi:hypothetical protein